MTKFKREDVKELDQNERKIYLKDGTTFKDVHYLIQTKEHIYIYEENEYNKFKFKHKELDDLEEIEEVFEKIGFAVLKAKIIF